MSIEIIGDRPVTPEAMDVVARRMTTIYGNTFLGVPVVQSWADMFLWEMFFSAYPEINYVAELGTECAGFSRYLHLQAKRIGANFMTFDIAPVGIYKRQYIADVLGDPDRVMRFIASHAHPWLIFCDNGNKPKEFHTYLSLIVSGDFIAVHDVPQEFNPEVHIDQGDPVKPLLLTESISLSSVTRWYQKVRVG